MNYRSSTDFLNGAVTRVLLLFDRPSYDIKCNHSWSKQNLPENPNVQNIFAWYIKTARGRGRGGGGCSKLTTSLVNVSLKIKTLILQINCYFLLEKKFPTKNNSVIAKDSHIFPTKNNCLFDNVVGIYLTR